jgi:chromosome partitioning protein
MPDLIIACLSQKGGVGKSTLARLIARTYAVAGWSVKIADFNTTQLTSDNWGKVRLANQLEPAIATQPYVSPQALKRERFNLVVADGRPDSDQSSLDIARLSTLVVVPTGLALDDLEPQLMFARELTSKGVEHRRILFVLNKTADSPSAVADARTYLAEFAVAEQDLSQRISYQRAQNTGRTLSEVGASVGSLEERADSLAAEIVDRINSMEITA